MDTWEALPSNVLSNRKEGFVGREAHHELEKKAIKLGLGQGIGALHLDWVLGGKHEKKGWKRAAFFANGHSLLLHRFEEGALGFWGCAVDFVSKHDFSKDGAWPKFEVAHTRTLGDQSGAEDVGRHKVRGELDPRKRKAHGLGDCAHKKGFAQPRSPFQENVTSSENRNQHLFNDFALANHNLFDCGTETVKGVGKVFKVTFRWGAWFRGHWIG